MEYRRYLLPLILLMLLAILQYRLWFESGGIFDIFNLKKQLTAEQVQNDKFKKRNQRLLLQIENLQKNQDAVEMRARQDLGMIKKDETFYQVIK